MRVLARAKVVLLALLGVSLLSGRLALAVHPYEHDAAVPQPSCEHCEHARVAGEGAEPGPTALPGAPPVTVLARRHVPSPPPAPRRSQQPRAPPALV